MDSDIAKWGNSMDSDKTIWYKNVNSVQQYK